MPQIFFYLFSLLAVASACLMVIFKNPVSSALSMVGAFVGLAALFIGLNAYFVGIMQILVYAGAIMVLFIFIIMLLDLKSEEKRVWKPANLAAGAIVPAILLLQILGVLQTAQLPEHQELDLATAATKQQELATARYADTLKEGEELKPEDVPVNKIQANLEAKQLPDVHLIGRTVFAGHGHGTSHNLPLQIMGVLLVVATIGVVVLSKKGSPNN
ncbi:NADH-quinone oxidoreductase subunit J [Roseibacillus ishigakijimensis]|uniref:NADH-quinone oxidoreductase subunit J n=1 Tax=Roseibacillus ishigakijimensis TaxID=454146 RepID=A0A934RM39_9BACT|nr:NADH-quinone oxidoreductase subunit J [Roseibacillus ishigakijimensis]MBK1833348.1 NADH-quinone oxidoreductase subunit J [Roseibacillus ishigakijimensis]